MWTTKIDNNDCPSTLIWYRHFALNPLTLERTPLLLTLPWGLLSSHRLLNGLADLFHPPSLITMLSWKSISTESLCCPGQFISLWISMRPWMFMTTLIVIICVIGGFHWIMLAAISFMIILEFYIFSYVLIWVT